MMKSLNIQTKKNLIELRGALSSTDAIHLKSQILEILSEDSAGLTIDICDIEYVDIAGLNTLVLSKKYANQNHKPLQIKARKGNPIFELVHLTKFGPFIDIETV